MDKNVCDCKHQHPTHAKPKREPMTLEQVARLRALQSKIDTEVHESLGVKPRKPSTT